MKKYVDVVFNLPIEKCFQYIVPDNLQEEIEIGKRVKAPFAQGSKFGFCIGFSDIPKVPKLREIQKVVDKTPLVDTNLLTLSKSISHYYLCPLGQVLNIVVPPGAKKISVKSSSKTNDFLLANIPEEATKPITLTPEQTNAILLIDEAIRKNLKEVFLLSGVTGSGKTEIYIRVVEKIVRSGRQAIMLIPEVSLTIQTIARFKARFSRLAILHSYLTEGERRDEWNKIKNNFCDVVIGTRSAIFAPLKNLGVIIVDEEFANTYKQETAPRYHIREVVLERAKLENAMVIFGTATPSLEVYNLVKTGKCKMISLPYRIGRLPLPKIEIVDMTTEMTKLKKYPVISERLRLVIRQTLDKGNQVIIFLNRRGFATYIACKRCGWILRCSRCDLLLNYHKQLRKAICHHCLFTSPLPELCPECKVGGIKKFGIGTERVEEILREEFPDATIARMDSDIMQKKMDYEKVISGFQKKEIDILVGTQMLAKGLDIPGVTLVGIISADTFFNIPDFRSGERAFQLIMQVAGRAGRGSDDSLVVIQTINPNHPAIKFLNNYDYIGFAEKELAMRKEFGFPPFSNLIRIVVEGKNEELVCQSVEKLAEELDRQISDSEAQILGPIAAPIYRIRNKFRYQILIKVFFFATSREKIKKVLGTFHSSCRLIVDVDPLDMM